MDVAVSVLVMDSKSLPMVQKRLPGVCSPVAAASPLGQCSGQVPGFCPCGTRYPICCLTVTWGSASGTSHQLSLSPVSASSKLLKKQGYIDLVINSLHCSDAIKKCSPLSSYLLKLIAFEKAFKGKFYFT